MKSVRKVIAVAASFVLGTLVTVVCWGLLFYAGTVVAKMQHPASTPQVKEVQQPAPRNCYTKEFEITAYCPCEKCCGKWSKHRKTASGKLVDGIPYRFVAADKSIPFGTLLEIEGFGRAIVEDRGGAIKDGKLDIYFPTHEQALKWGRQKRTVRVFSDYVVEVDAVAKEIGGGL